MYKISIVGIDNSGKTSVVRSLDEVEGADTIHVTSYQNNGSRIARVSGRVVNRFAQFGETHDLKVLTGFAYLLHLFPYYFEEKAKNSSQVLVSDRDPIVDTLCYSDFYLPDGFSSVVRPPLKFFLEHSFSYPSSFCYLEVSPEVSTQRNNKPIQLHDKVESLSLLRDLFEKEMFNVERRGISVVRIDTDAKSLEEVTDEVKFYVKRLL